MKIKFDQIYDGEWNYESHEGVGVNFIGIPTDEIKFVQILQSQSCNPIISHKICDELILNGNRITTTRAHLDFNYINECVNQIGVRIEILPPKLSNHHPDFDSLCAKACLYYVKNQKDPEDAKRYYSVLKDEDLSTIMELSNYLADALNRRPASLKPYCFD